jgi:ubiquinone/menaquinone biosynthesis C-methylase UbiE
MAMEPQKKSKWYHGRGVVDEQYPLAKDRREIWRLNLQHRLVKGALGGRNFCANVRNPAAILDVGCGTGIWPLEVARRFKQARRVIGIDKYLELSEKLRRVESSRLHPDIPKSLSFQEADALKPLPFGTEEFDYVHGRFSASFIPLALWPQVLAEMVRVTKRGGWIEVAEAELSTNEGPLLQEVNQALNALSEKLGIGIVPPLLPGWLRSLGLSKVEHRRILLSGKELATNAADREGAPGRDPCGL